MYRQLTPIFLIIILCFLLSHTAHAQPIIEIDTFQWTDSVDPETRKYNKKLSAPLKGREVVFWTRLKGARELFEKLRESPDGKFPIRHAWYKYTATGLRTDPEVIELNFGRKEDLQKLGNAIDSDGNIFWRVWSQKKQLSSGTWLVKVLDESNNTLYYTEQGVQKPCSIEIEVQ